MLAGHSSPSSRFSIYFMLARRVTEARTPMWYLGVMVDEHAMTVRLDDDRFQRLRREAYEREMTRTDIIREALDAHFAAYYSQSPEVRYGSR